MEMRGAGAAVVVVVVAVVEVVAATAVVGKLEVVVNRGAGGTPPPPAKLPPPPPLDRAVVVVARVDVVVVGGGVPGVTSPLLTVLRSWLSVVATQISVDAHETLLSWLVVAALSAFHVEPPLPVPASDRVVPAPVAQHVNVLAQLTELTQPFVAGEGRTSHDVPRSGLVATALPPPL
jgi:hypothetical protein